MSDLAVIHVEVFGHKELAVRCIAKGAKLQIDNVTFHGVTDAQFQSIVDAIEIYLLRKRGRELAARHTAAAVPPAPES